MKKANWVKCVGVETDKAKVLFKNSLVLTNEWHHDTMFLKILVTRQTETNIGSLY